MVSIGAPWGSDVVELAGIRVPASRVIAGGVALVLVAALGAAVKFTDWGVAMRSAAEDGETASLMGIRLNRVAAGAWALAGALAAVGGLFLTSFPAAGVTGGRRRWSRSPRSRPSCSAGSTRPPARSSAG